MTMILKGLLTLVARYSRMIKSIFVLLLLFAIALSQFNKGAAMAKRPTDLKSILGQMNSPAYAAAVDYFLKVDGIPGESQDPKHKDEIQLLSWSWGSTQTVSPGGAGNSGKPNFQDFSFTMKVSKASPKLFLACASGHPTKEAVLSVRRSAGPEIDFLIITFSDLVCKFYQEKGDPQSFLPVDQVSLNYSKIKIEYTQLGNDGKPVAAPIIESWNFEKSSAE